MRRVKNLLMCGLVACAGMVAGCNSTDTSNSKDAEGKANLEKFDKVDESFSQRKDMKLFRELHCADVKVFFPDGRTTVGVDQHVQDIEGMFNGTPNLRVTSHPVKVGSGEWTAVTGIGEATFSEPMKLPDGSSIPPTGKTGQILMATFARWSNGCIAEEHLYFDGATYMKGLGLSH